MRVRGLLVPLLWAVACSMIFWPRLWYGDGFIGGDTYTYFFPQKAFLANQLASGIVPFWNHLTGHGYPLLAESQTALLYPTTIPLYSLLDLNTAYVAVHLAHYIFAFVGCVLLAQRFEINRFAGILAAIVFVYGWFPPRSSLEWAIVTGSYLPWTLWALEGWFQTRRARHLAALACLHALQLLAGHFNLAFITTLLLVAYSVVRGASLATPSATADNTPPPPTHHRVPHRFANLLPVLISIGLGYTLAGPQLVPSYDLKRHSQRTEESEEFAAGYGHIPPRALTQLILPWLWYGDGLDTDTLLASHDLWGIDAATNKVEAQLYTGLLPLLLASLFLARSLWNRRSDPRLLWLALFGFLAMIYATGWLLPITRHLPGFGYFRGPGRYGLITVLAIALLAGRQLQHWLSSRGRYSGSILATLVIGLTLLDLQWMAHRPWYTFVVSAPPIEFRNESVVHRRLLHHTTPPRMLAPGPNLPTLTGAAASPPYLGFGPDAYYEPGGRLPDTRFLAVLSGKPLPDGVNVSEQFEWIRDAGITHLLSMGPLPFDWPIDLDWQGVDPLLHRAWGRHPQEPLYLYSVRSQRGRAWLEPATPHDQLKITTYSPNSIVVETSTTKDATLVLADLPWHEWNVTLDGKPVHTSSPPPQLSDTTTRAIPLQRRLQIPPGNHTIHWTYRPRSFWWGCALSAAAALALAALLYRNRSTAPSPTA